MQSAPTPQNPAATAAGQANYNQQAATENQAGSNMNQYNPYGSLNYQQTGTGPNGIPIYSSSVSLSPIEQNLFNQYTSGQASAGAGGAGLLANANYANSDPTTAIGTGTSGISGQMMSGYLQQMSPYFQQQTQQLQTQLLNEGLSPSPTANPNDPTSWGPFEKAMYQNQTTQSNQVAAEAAQFQPQAFSEATSLYQMPATLGMQLGQYGQNANPNSDFTQNAGFNTAAPNYEGDVNSYNQEQLQSYAANQQMLSALMQGAGKIGAAGVGLLG